MALTQIPGNYFKSGSISAAKVVGGSLGSGNPKITNVEITDSTYTVLDDTAVDVGGGYIKITGTRFVTGCQVLIKTTTAISTTFISSTEVRAQIPAMAAGTYIVYLVNPDGGVAVRVNGITYSGSPSWVTGSSFGSYYTDEQISIQLSATGASSYSVASGSSLPSGVTLSSGGLLSGSVTGLITDTTYTFSIAATDAELQDSPRTFSVTIYVADPYFKYTTLLLTGDGANDTVNYTFLDSSSSNFTITRQGNTSQGSFNPYSPASWSVYFDGSGDYLNFASNNAFQFGTNDFTMEFWVCPNLTQSVSYPVILSKGTYPTDANTWYVSLDVSNKVIALTYGTPAKYVSSSITFGEFTHIAIVRSGGNITMYKNGVAVSSNTGSNDFTNTYSLYVGRLDTNTTNDFAGYISNLRIVKGTAVYTSNFTPSTSTLTSITNTSLLICHSKHFIDGSANNFSITRNGDARVTNWSPFAPATAYSSAVHGGSAYFDGAGDYLTAPNSTAFSFGTGDFTIEFWAYHMASTSYRITNRYSIGPETGSWGFNINPAGGMSFTQVIGGEPGVGSSAFSSIRSWNHYAVSRENGTLRLFFNGTIVGSGSFTTNLNSSTYSLLIGSSPETTMVGYMSNLRIIKGVAAYTANFTPPVSPVTATANTVLLLNFANAGIVDATTRNFIELADGAKISAEKKYGTGSIVLDGNGDYLYGNYDPSMDLLPGSFTVECWIYTTNLKSTGQRVFSTGGGVVAWNSTNGIHVLLQINDSSGVIGLQMYNGLTSSTGISSTLTVSANTWTHIAGCYDATSGTMYIAVNGTVKSGNVSAVVRPSTNPVWNVGSIPGENGSSFIAFQGYIDDLRVTKGIARYTANFTPPARNLSLK